MGLSRLRTAPAHGLSVTALAVVVLAASVCAAQPPQVPEWAGGILEKWGLIVVRGESQGFAEAYDRLADAGYPPYVTSDAVLYGTAAVLDRTLAALEEGDLYDRVAYLSAEMARLSEEQYLLSSDPLVKEAARLNTAFFAVGLSLLDENYFPPETVRGLVERELALIEEGEAVTLSPILGRTPLDDVMGPGEDYSNYMPHGRYASRDRLARFHRAITWYGRMAFALPEGRLADYGLTRQALLLVRAIGSESGEWLELWERIQEPLMFFYGDPGDPTVVEYGDIATDVFGEDFDIELLADAELLDAFAQRVSKTAATHFATHELRGLRFLVRSFPLDVDYLYDLARSDLRSLPTTLDLMALLDSTTARSVLADERRAFDSEVYRRTFDSIKYELDGLTYGDWTRDLHWSWLYALRPLLGRSRASTAPYTRGEAADAKALSTASAAWALMRNTWGRDGGRGDAARLGRIDEVACLVEPCPEVYARLIELVDHTSDRLLEHYLLSDEIKDVLDVERATLSKLETAARRQLEGHVPTCPVNSTARPASALADAVLGRAPGGSELAFVATAYRDPATGGSLEFGVGRPDLIYVRTGDGSVYAGAVFSFYEFEQSDAVSRRGVDWIGMLDRDEIARPDWTSRFVVD